MSDAMNEIWANLQNNFICSKKEQHCDATLCYTYPGPMNDDNEPEADFHTLSMVPLSVIHNKTEVGDTVLQQMVELDVKLEKINLCEKLNPELAVPGQAAMSQPMQCHTARKCQIVGTRFKDCYDGAEEGRPGMMCPDDAAFIEKLVKAQMDVVMGLCNSL